MRTLLLLLTALGVCGSIKAQNDFLHDLLLQKASPALKAVLDRPDSFRYQLIYTRIDRNQNNEPKFEHFTLRVDKNEYFNPASTVKMPLAFLALEKLNNMKVRGVDKYTALAIDSAYNRQTRVMEDASSSTGRPSIAHYVKKVFLVSDNDAYNRLYEFLGQQYLNQQLWNKGYKDMRITRRFVTMNEDENRHTNPVRFLGSASELVYEQPAAVSRVKFDFSKQVLIGHAHYNREEQLISAPMDFTTHNNAPLQDLQQLLQSVLFPESVSRKQRFNLTEDDYRLLYRYMSELPSESKHPRYDTAEFFDSYTKFFLFKDGRRKIPKHIRVFNKTGWSYGFLTDVAYIVDFENKVEFMLSGVIYVNSDGVLNDDKYEYKETGYPFFREVGEIIYEYELSRPRKYAPDLSRFRVDYD